MNRPQHLPCWTRRSCSAQAPWSRKQRCAARPASPSHRATPSASRPSPRRTSQVMPAPPNAASKDDTGAAEPAKINAAKPATEGEPVSQADAEALPPVEGAVSEQPAAAAPAPAATPTTARSKAEAQAAASAQPETPPVLPAS